MNSELNNIEILQLITNISTVFIAVAAFFYYNLANLDDAKA